MDILRILIEWLFVTSLVVQERETSIKAPQTVKCEEGLKSAEHSVEHEADLTDWKLSHYLIDTFVQYYLYRNVLKITDYRWMLPGLPDLGRKKKKSPVKFAFQINNWSFFSVSTSRSIPHGIYLHKKNYSYFLIYCISSGRWSAKVLGHFNWILEGQQIPLSTLSCPQTKIQSLFHARWHQMWLSRHLNTTPMATRSETVCLLS